MSINRELMRAEAQSRPAIVNLLAVGATFACLVIGGCLALAAAIGPVALHALAALRR